MESICCLADTHRTVPDVDSQSLWPRFLATLPAHRAEAFYLRIRAAIERSYETALEWIGRRQPWDAIIHLGDVIGGYGEAGCTHPSVRYFMEKTASDLGSCSPRVYYCLGNHDLGYQTPVAGVEGSGFYPESVLIGEEVFGHLYWQHEQKGFLHLGVCAPLAESENDAREIVSRRRDQVAFVGDTLASHRGAWTLYAHTPFVVQHLHSQIGKQGKNMRALVYADLHSPLHGTILRGLAHIPLLPWISGKTWRRCLPLLRKGILCPSVAPLWWRGNGLLRVDADTQEYRAREILLDPGSRPFRATSSLLRCLSWMIPRQPFKSSCR